MLFLMITTDSRSMMLKIELNIDLWLILTLIVITIIALTYFLFDINYFIRVLLLILWDKIYKKRIKINETTINYNICTTNDLDIFLDHMNNARFLRELDFARMYFYGITEFYQLARKSNAQIFQTACNIRYRRIIPLFTTYKITTRIIHWTDKELYFEQQFVTLSDNFVRAVALSKQAVVGIEIGEIMKQLLDKSGETFFTEATPELDDWIKSMEKSSDRLKKKN